MKKVTYTCNMCAEPKERNELMCLYYGISPEKREQHYHLVESLDASDKHVCKSCIEIIKNYREK